MRKYGKAFLALSLGLSMIGCSKAPSAVDPGKNVTPPAVVNPVGNNLTPSTGDAYCNPTPVPVVVPPPAVVPLPLCNFLAFTACIGGCEQLFLYDDILKDNYALVGAGEDINNPMYFDGGKIVYDRCGRILVYDILTETNCYLDDVNSVGYVHRPSISWAGDKMVFLDFCGRAFIWCCNPCISVCELAKVNAVGEINWISISADGNWAVFTTCDGCLYTYDICNPMVCLIADARLVCTDVGFNNCSRKFRDDRRDERCLEDIFDNSFAFITQPAISATGRQIVFTAVGQDRYGCPITSIWRYDRLLGCLDPMPFANAALNNLVALDPMFKCFDETNVYYEALVPGILTSKNIELEDDCASYAHGNAMLWCKYYDRPFCDAEAVCEAVNDGRRDYRDKNGKTHQIGRDGFSAGISNAVTFASKRCGKKIHLRDEHVHDILEGFRVLDYNWLTETVRTLTIVNNVHGDTETFISDPDLFCCDDFKNGKGDYGRQY